MPLSWLVATISAVRRLVRGEWGCLRDGDRSTKRRQRRAARFGGTSVSVPRKTKNLQSVNRPFFIGRVRGGRWSHLRPRLGTLATGIEPWRHTAKRCGLAGIAPTALRNSWADVPDTAECLHCGVRRGACNFSSQLQWRGRRRITGVQLFEPEYQLILRAFHNLKQLGDGRMLDDAATASALDSSCL